MKMAKVSIIILLLLMLWPFILKLHLWLPLDGGLRYLGGDFAGIFYAWFQTAIDGWQHEGLPLYTPYEGLGQPLHINLQSMVFYPPTMVVAFLFPNGVSFPGAEFYDLLHLCLAGIGAFLLARVVGLNRWPAAFSGAAFAGGGFFLNYIANMSLTASAAWTPWVLAATLKAMERNGWRWVPAAAAAIALSVLGGLPQPAYYVVILVTLISIWRSVEQRSFNQLASYLVIGILAFALAAPALLPGAVDLPLLIRGGDWRGDMNTPSLLIARLVAPVAPHVTSAFGATASFSSFAGIGMFLLAIAGMTGRLIKKRWLLIVGLIVVFFITIASGLGLANILSSVVPGYGFFREHDRAGVMLTLLVGIFAGAGLQTMGRWQPLQRKAVIISCILLIALQIFSVFILPPLTTGSTFIAQTLFFIGIILLIIAAVLLSRYRFAIIGTAVICMLELFILGNTNNMWPGINDSLEGLGKKIRPLQTSTDQALPRIARRFKQNIATQIAAFKLNTLYTGNSNTYRLLLRFWSVGERNPEVLSQFDVRYYIYGNKFRTRPRTPADFPLDSTNQVQRFDLGQKIAHEIHVEADGAFEAVVAADGRIIPLNAAEKNETSDFSSTLLLDKPTHLESLWVRLLNDDPLRISHIYLDEEELDLPSHLEKIGSGLYRDNDALPRAYLVPAADYFPSLGHIAAKLRSGIDLQEHLLLLQDSSPPADSIAWSAEQWAEARADITHYGRRTVKIKFNSPTNAWLVLSDFYHKNWQATLDGASVPVVRANFIARAIRVPAGRHAIVFRFDDPLVVVGLWIAAAAIVACLAIMLIGRPRREKKSI